MKAKTGFIILALNIAFSDIVNAQSDSISYATDLYFLGASQAFQPHWQVANRYGIFDRAEKSQLAGLFALGYQRGLGKKVVLDSKIEFNLRSDISNSYFQQLYLNIKYGSFQIKLGKEAYTLAQYSEDLSSGSLFLSNNARPLPRVGAGFYDYTPMPFVGRFVEFKGAMNFGILDDERRVFDGIDLPLFHEKFLYLRSKTLPINVHLGLNHNAMFGGTRPDGTKIPVDFLATFFGKGSDKVGGGEQINVAGAHFGLYDAGLSWKIKESSFQVYFQKPFSDGSGRRLNSKDSKLGLLLETKRDGLISGVNYEYINTRHQGGHGIPDPIVNGNLVIPSEIVDIDQFMWDNFDEVTNGFTIKQLYKYLEDHLDYGYKFGGRDDLYNNYLYPVGLAYNEYALGNSLFTTKSMMANFETDFDGQYDFFFVNNRIEAHHLAFEGYISRQFSYRTKLTYSRNYGSYAGANKGRYNWGSKEDPEYYNSYYFKDGLKQAYTFFEVDYVLEKWKGARLTTSLAYDFGEIYHNFGVLFGFHYNGFFTIGKSKPGIKTRNQKPSTKKLPFNRLSLL